MSNSRMVEAVNRVIINLLAGPGELFLPDVGSLFTEQQGAKQVDKRTILPACRVVTFSSQPRGASLVDEIAKTAGVDEQKAQEIYETWLARVRAEETLTIEGVGELKFKHFTLSSEFDKLLNPAGHAPLVLRAKRSLDWVIWLGVVAALIAAGLFGYQFVWKPAKGLNGMLTPRNLVVATDSVAVSIDTLADGSTADGLTAMAADTVSRPAAPPHAEPEKATVVVPADPNEVLATVVGRSYVVVGVFSSKENALRAAAEARQHGPKWQGRIYRFGDKFMVSAFESDSREACGHFIDEISGSASGLWTYSAR